MKSTCYDIDKGTLKRYWEYDRSGHFKSKSETCRVLPPLQPDILFHTSEMKECLADMDVNIKKSGVFFYQFKSETDRKVTFYPEGCVNLMFECGENAGNARVVGICTQPLELALQKNQTYFCVNLYSTFGLKNRYGDINRTVDQVVDFEDIFFGTSLREQIALADDFLDRIQLMRAFYTGLADENYMPGLEEECARILCMSGGGASISDLEENTCYTKRYIQQRFISHYGIAPKLYGMIKRYQSAMVMLLEKEEAATNTAYENGYYDQSHFIKEFKRFSGESPQLFKERLFV